ncbi:MAG TPA: hypothetical protein VFA44_13115 [Gaiellaceae bacterium]|nr:hypothetical protein [Gaiellaceae bacterium]
MAGGGFTPRFVFEVVFLVLLAVAAGLAELRPLVIGLVMGGAWVLVTLIEWLAWRSEQRVEPPPAWPGPDGEDVDSWDIDEILAPLPEDDAEIGSTSVLPPADEREHRDEP